MTFPLALLLAAAPAAQGRYLMLLDRLPAGVVEWRLEGTTYRYTSTHAYRAGPRVREVVLEVPRPVVPGTEPEVLALATRPAPGCRDVVEELSGRTEKLCVDAFDKGGVTGRIGEAKFDARYGDDGRLMRLSVSGATFIASSAALPAGGVDPFGKGFAIGGAGKTLAFEPPLDGATVVSPRAGAEGPGSGSCLEVARSRAAQDPSMEVVVGLVAEDGRAWPHAWLRERRTGSAVDPTMAEGDPGLTHRRYVSIPTDRAGAVFLELLSGARKVVWTK